MFWVYTFGWFALILSNLVLELWCLGCISQFSCGFGVLRLICLFRVGFLELVVCGFGFVSCRLDTGLFNLCVLGKL